MVSRRGKDRDESPSVVSSLRLNHIKIAQTQDFHINKKFQQEKERGCVSADNGEKRRLSTARPTLSSL